MVALGMRKGIGMSKEDPMKTVGTDVEPQLGINSRLLF
jgi:hypothetical protein